MNKLFTKIAAILSATMAVGVGVAAVSSKAKETSPVHAADVSDELTASSFTATGTTYTAFSNVSASSDARYAGNSAKNGSNIQLRSKNSNSGIVSTTSGGKVKSVEINVASGSNTIDVYGSNSAYSAASDLYGSSKGTKVGSVTSTGTITFTDDYEYVGIRSNNGAIYLSSVVITWTSGSTSYTVTKTATNCSISGADSVDGSQAEDFEITGSTNYDAPETITVKAGTTTLTKNTHYSYSVSAYVGYLTIYKDSITANITIIASGVAQLTVTDSVTHGSLSSTARIHSGDDLDVTIVPDSGYTYPTSVNVTMGGNDVTEDIVYENGEILYGPVTGNIVVTATCPAAGNTYSITTNVTNGAYSGDTTITDNGGVASVTITPTGDYKLPTSVSVSGANHTYDSNSGVISLSNATGNVTISAAMVALTEYSISVTANNGTYSGASTIKESRTASITFTHDSGFGHPESVSVTNATSDWNRNDGILTLSNPTGTVTVIYTAVGDQLDSITISPSSGSYTLGDDFVKPTVTAHYTVSADKVIDSSNVSVSGYDPYTASETAQSVTISYTEGGITKTTPYSATVSAASVQTTTYYQKCTSMSDIVDGGKYVLVGYKESTTQYYAMPSYSSGNNIQGATVTLTENGTRLTEENMSTAAVYTLTSTGTTNQYYIGDGSLYLYAAGSGTSNHLKGKASTDSSAGAFSISYSTFFSVVAASSNRNTMRFNATNNPPIFSCYASNDTQTEIMFFKEVKESTGTADLIRITASYTGGQKYVGDPISTSDFAVKKQLNTGNELIDVASGYTISANTLEGESNTITVSYTEGNFTKTFDVVVSATPRAATVTSVTLVQGEHVVKDYIDYSAATWDYTDLTVHCVWSDSTFNEDLSLADLVLSGDATVSPAKPSTGVTSFTVSYEYHETDMTNNTVSGITVVDDYVTGISWTGTTESHFKAFSGGQLTAAQVGAWSVVPTFAGAGQQSGLSFGSYTLKVGSKTISSLPYTWVTEDDGEELSITYGKDKNGNDFVKKNGTAVANICATINAIDHTETISGEIEKSVTWTKNDSIAAYGTTSLCDDGVALDENIFMQGAKGDAGTEIRFWSDGIRTYTGGNTLTFTPSNGAVIKKITLPTVTVTSDSTSSASSPYTITGGDSAVVFDIGSKSTIGSDIVVEYTIEGSETTTTHYANDINHFDAQKTVVAFAKFMNTTMNGTNVCSGTFANLESAWGDVAEKYDELFGESQEALDSTELAWAKHMLEYATAQWGSDAEAACVEKAMKTYEYCVAKYDLDPFMAEFKSVSKTSALSPIMDIASNTPMLVTIITSMVGLSAVGGYFFLRKRKEI